VVLLLVYGHDLFPLLALSIVLPIASPHCTSQLSDRTVAMATRGSEKMITLFLTYNWAVSRLKQATSYLSYQKQSSLWKVRGSKRLP